MVHHIVMWKFKPEIEEGRKADLKKEMAQNLASLVVRLFLKDSNKFNLNDRLSHIYSYRTKSAHWCFQK